MDTHQEPPLIGGHEQVPAHSGSIGKGCASSLFAQPALPKQSLQVGVLHCLRNLLFKGNMAKPVTHSSSRCCC